MVCSYQFTEQLQLLSRNWQAKRSWISWDLQKLDLLEKDPSNTRSNMKFEIKIKKKRKYLFVELLISKLNKISSDQFLLILSDVKNHEESSQNQSTWITWIIYFGLSFIYSWLGFTLLCSLVWKYFYDMHYIIFLFLNPHEHLAARKKLSFVASFLLLDLLLHYWFFINL